MSQLLSDVYKVESYIYLFVETIIINFLVVNLCLLTRNLEMSGSVMFSALLMSHGNSHKFNLFFFSPYRHSYGLMESIIGIS